MPHSLLLKKCRLYHAPEDAPLVEVLVRDGSIAAVAGSIADPGPVRTLDAGGRTLIPGLLDMHIHGAGGADVLDGDPDSLRTMARTLARLGTTSFLATTYLRPDDAHRQLEAAASTTGAETGGARLLGLYVEGPFVNPVKRGGIPLTGILPPGDAVLDELLARTAGTLRVMTIAPELPGALAQIERLRAAGVLPSFGHSDATYDQARDGIAAGIGHATHLFNAMRGVHHREPGPLPALLEAGGVAVELICDGTHVSAPVARVAHRLFGPDRVVAITDAMRTTGLPDGHHRFGEWACESRDGVARYPDGTLIGTSIPLLEVVRRLHRFTGCTLAEAVDAATRVPARVLGVDHLQGSIAAGLRADLVLLEPDLSVWATLVGGRVVHGPGAAIPAGV